jgi:hypothetical protein
MATTFTRSVTSFSWIDPKTDLPEYDQGNPGSTITRADVFGKQKYRFANFLEARISVEGHGRIVEARVAPESGLYLAPSFLNIPALAYGYFPRVERFYGRATFTLLVGARTHSPETIGRATGETAGAVAGSPLPLPPGVGPAIGRKVGGWVGNAIAAKTLAFPPIWTEVELTIYADGTATGKLLRHSAFPSVSFYLQPPVNLRPGIVGNLRTRPAPWVPLTVLPDSYWQETASSYDGDKAKLAHWKKNGWGPTSGTGGARDGNPWGLTEPEK